VPRIVVKSRNRRKKAKIGEKLRVEERREEEKEEGEEEMMLCVWLVALFVFGIVYCFWHSVSKDSHWLLSYYSRNGSSCGYGEKRLCFKQKRVVVCS